MTKKLNNLKVAMLVAQGFEQSEMVQSRKAIEDAGAKVSLISPEDYKVKGWQHDQWGDEFLIDVPLDQANADKYDALILPGGVMNPDKLRIIPLAVEFIRKFFIAKKPIAAICHGPWPLINAQAVKGYTMTSWPSLEIDLKNAGAKWVDQEVVVDRTLITSRKPADIPQFNRVILEVLSKL